LTGGTPPIGFETTPSRRTVRIVPVPSVTRKLPSGRNAIDHGPLSRVVIVSTFSAGEGVEGAA
jgi:hypothetical protein